MVEGVCTSGGSILEACEKVQADGYGVATTMCIVDCEEGGTETVRSPILTFPSSLPKGTVTLREIGPLWGRILLEPRPRINDLEVTDRGENATKHLNVTVPVKLSVSA